MSKSKCKAAVPSKCPHHGYPLTLIPSFTGAKTTLSAEKSILNKVKKEYDSTAAQWKKKGKEFNHADVVNKISVKGNSFLRYNQLAENLIVAETKLDLTREGYNALVKKVSENRASPDEVSRYNLASELTAVFNVTQETFYTRRAAKRDSLIADLKDFNMRKFADREVKKLELQRDKTLSRYRQRFGKVEYDSYGMRTGDAYRHEVATKFVYNSLIQQIGKSVDDYERFERRKRARMLSSYQKP